MVKLNLINNSPALRTLQKPFALIISAPSGTGKTTIITQLLNQVERLKLSISTTTRSPREGENNGKDYFFIDTSLFESKVENGQFLEYDIIYDNLYGTSKREIINSFESGNDVIFDINWSGASQIRSKIDSILVYLLPPSLTELRNRLVLRSKDSIEIIEKRLCKAKEEIQYADNYDYILVNNDLQQTIANLKVIIQSERIKRNRQNYFLEYLKEETIIF